MNNTIKKKSYWHEDMFGRQRLFDILLMGRDSYYTESGMYSGFVCYYRSQLTSKKYSYKTTSLHYNLGDLWIGREIWNKTWHES